MSSTFSQSSLRQNLFKASTSKLPCQRCVAFSLAPDAAYYQAYHSCTWRLQTQKLQMLAMSKTDVQPGSTETQQLRVMVSAAGVSLLCFWSSRTMLSVVPTLTGSRSTTAANRFHFRRYTFPRTNRFLFPCRSHGIVFSFLSFHSLLFPLAFLSRYGRRYPSFPSHFVVKSCASRFRFPSERDFTSLH